MDNDNNQTNKFGIYIVIVIVLLIIFFCIWYLGHSVPKYHIFYSRVKHDNRKQHFQANIEDDDINTESITIGGRFSAHTSPIIASPYNPPKKKKSKKTIPEYLSPYHQLHPKIFD